MYVYDPRHLEDLAGADREWIKALQGLAAGVQCIGGELPFFFLSGMLQPFKTHYFELKFCQACCFDSNYLCADFRLDN